MDKALSGVNSLENAQLISVRLMHPIVDIRDLEINVPSNNGDICFVVEGRAYEYYGNFFILQLRKKFPGCHIALMPTDLIKNYHFEIEEIKECFDAVFVFELMDSIKYGFYYLTPPYEYSSIEKADEDSDFFFAGSCCGRKKRLEQVISLFDRISSKGYRCDFVIPDIPLDVWYTRKNISKERIPFQETLVRMNSSRCIVELLQDGAYSPTIRYAQSVLYEKYYLTDSEEVLKNPVFGEINKNVFVYSNDLDISFVEKPIHYEEDCAKIFFSNKRLIESIQRIMGRINDGQAIEVKR